MLKGEVAFDAKDQRYTLLFGINALIEIEAAIARAQTAVWATCTQCGEPIGEARLEAIPSTDRCVTCKANSTSW